MSESPLVSVLTPTYNHAPYIGACLASTIAQTYTEWEQIMLDDGSSDGTVEIAASRRDGRVRIETQEHRGIWFLAETYNRALALARGQLVAILEGDDYWPPDKLASLVPLLADPDVVLAYGRTEVVMSDGRSTGLFIPSRRHHRLFGRSALENRPVGSATKAMLHSGGLTLTFPCSVVIRRTALEEIGGFRRAEGLPVTDYPTFLELSLKGRFAYLDRVMGYWRRHPSSSTWSFHRALDRNLPAYALRFLEQHAHRWSREDARRIRRSWSGWTDFLDGRTLLLEGRWRESRVPFARGVRNGSPAMRAASVLGYLASYLHRDLEMLIRLSGRIDVRSSGVVPRPDAR